MVAAAVIALAAVLIWYLPRLHHAGARPGPSAAGASPATPGPPASPLAQPSPPPVKPAQMTGQQLPRNAGLSVPTGGFQPAWLSVATGRVDPVGGLPANGNSYQLFRVAGGWAVQPFPPANAGCTDCAPRPLPVYYLADGSAAVRRLGAADFTAPAADAGTLWLISYSPGANMRTAAATARQIGVTGRAFGPRLTLPAGYVIYQGTRAGLLLVPEVAGSGPVRYELWDARTRRVTQSFEHLIAAAPGELAWLPPCAPGCQVSVLHLPGGHTSVISLPGRGQPGPGAFSPDGSLLAMPVTARFTADGRPTATQLAVAAVSTGRLTVIPGSTVGIGNGVDFGWQAGTGQLIAVVSVRNEWQIAVWRPGGARLSIAFARVPDSSWPVAGRGPY
jgi:hypothetical protein